MKRNVFTFLLLGALLTAPLVGQSTSSSTATALDQQMLAALDPNATNSTIATAVDGIFSAAGFDPTYSDYYSYTSEIVAVQQAYNAGNHAAQDESGIVTSVNNLVTNLGLPTYSRTTASEVRQMHVALLLAYPRFLLSTSAAGNSTPTLHTQMSPIEQLLLLCSMVEQKLYNPQYQMTADEYNAYYAALHTGSTLPAVTDRSAQVTSALQNAINADPNSVFLNLANAVGDCLGYSGN